MSLDIIMCGSFTILIQSFYAESSWLVRNIPIDDTRAVVTLLLFSYFPIIKQQMGIRLVGIA